MLLKTFKFCLISRVLILTATLILLSFLIFKMDFIFVPFAVALLGAYQIFSLIHFTEKTNRDLGRFLLSIRYDDTTQAFTSDGLGESFNELKKAFGEVMAKLKETRSDKEAHARYLKTIIEHVGIGLLVYKPDGTVDLINNATKKLLKVAGLRDIKSMKTRFPSFVDILLNLKNGDKRLVKLEREGETGYLSMFAHTFLLRDEEYILVSIQNIQEELEEKEMEAWQNLIRVLTHEIMNSITPISSMTSTLMEMLIKDKADRSDTRDSLEPEKLEEMFDALKVIHRRSEGLMSFVSAYRNMTLIPKPKYRIMSVKDLFKRVEGLMNNRLIDSGISFKWSVDPETLELTADPDLMEQVMINLILNAIDALNERNDPLITLSADMDAEGKVVVAVEDNGVGIIEEALGKIFIPFFTTKKQGSGIGLSLSRQILRMHHATIRVHSEINKGTRFTLKFS
jgi:two-component system, NtrC family, nitrogen regulation sensor histidine kinase NtrY